MCSISSFVPPKSKQEKQMKIDPVKLEKAIDNMSSVCEKGRAEIKTMLSEGFGVEFKKKEEEIKLKVGDYVQHSDGEIYRIVFIYGRGF